MRRYSLYPHIVAAISNVSAVNPVIGSEKAKEVAIFQNEAVMSDELWHDLPE
jgi:hypothetical protein